MEMEMEMETFAARVCAALEKELGTGYRADVKKVRKNNGIVLHGLMIGKKDQNVLPTIYLEEFLAAHEAGEPFDMIVRELLDIYRRHAPEKPLDMDFFHSFEKAKDRICFHLIRREGNEELLKEIPHTGFLDLAVCFCYDRHWDGLGNGSILLYNTHMKEWNTSAEELYRLAERNTPRLFPWVCRTLMEILGITAGDAAGAEDSAFREGRSFHMLSNETRTYGAACILYPGVLEELAQKEQCSLYIVPSSIHETLLLADTGDADCVEQLKGMIAEVNRTKVAPEEVLSDTLYYYDLEKKQLRIA